MADVLLIRHGQASFGAADYDRLSVVGEEQSRRLGNWFKQTGQVPDLIATGRLRRHLRTADLCAEAAGVDAQRIVLPGFDEMDHEEILARHRPDLAEPAALVAELGRAHDPHREFQKLYAEAATRWISSEFDSDYSCDWSTFRENVLGSLRELAAQRARTVWAFTSGGPIAVVVNALVGAPSSQALLLAWPLVNTSVSRITAGSKGNQLVSFNGWPHLESAIDKALVTYR